MEENERTLRNMSIGDILDYSIEVYKRNFKVLTLLALIFYIPFMLLYTLAVSNFSGEMAGFTGGITEAAADTPYMLLAYYAAIAVAGLVFLVYSMTIKPVMDAAIIKIIYSDVVAGKKEAWKQAVKAGFKKLPSIIGNKLVYYLILFGVGSSAVVILGLVAVAITGAFAAMSAALLMGGAAGGGAGAGVAVVLFVVLLVAVYLGILLFIFYFFFKFGFGTQSIIIENKKAVEALSRSITLTKKSFWHIAVSYSLGALLFFSLPTILAAGAQLFLAVNKSLFMAATVFTQVAGSLIYPYLMVLSTILFINLKIRKEGLDLEVKVDILLEEQRKREASLLSEAPTAEKPEEQTIFSAHGETPDE